MASERLAAEKLAEALVQVASSDAKLLSCGDPVKRVLSHLEGVEHRVIVQATSIVLQRFHDTVAAGRVPELDQLAAVAEKVALPSLSKLESCLTARRAFQAACTLTPLLNRAAALATQCCAIAVRGTPDASVLLPFVQALGDLAEVFSDAIIRRAEMFRPFDAARITASYSRFANLQSLAAEAVLATGFGGFDADAAPATQRTLAPTPAKPAHAWRYEQLRQFWDASCANKYLDEAVPIDALAVLLLQAAGAEANLPNREALMRRLKKFALQASNKLSAPELDACGPEMRRCGGLKAWVHAVALSGGEEAPRPVTASSSLAGSSGARSLGATWCSAASGYSTAAPLSARTTGSSFGTPRGVKDGKRPFVLSASFRRPQTGQSDDRSPLADSVSRGLLKASQRLVLGDKVHVDNRDVGGETPLHLAASQDFKHAPLGSLLLSKGADSNAEDRHLATPLHAAAASGHTLLAKELVSHGADVRRGDRWGSTPLHRAADSGQAQLAEMLLTEGASAHSSDEWGATPLHRATARGQLAVAERLLGMGYAAVNAEDRRGDQPLHVAAGRGDYAVVKLLLEHGGDANARSRVAGKTPEDCARDRGHADVVTLLQNRQEWVSSRSQALVAAS